MHRLQNRQQQEIDKPERIIDAKRQFRNQITQQNQQRTQTVEDQENARLRLKQNQYARRSHDRLQTRHSDEQKPVEFLVR